MIGAYIAGILSINYGRIKLISRGILIYSILIIFSMVDSYVIFTISRLLLGIIVGFIYPTVLCYVIEIVPAHARGKILAWVISFSYVG
jgi:MFS transporter, putative metabolite transport protein